MIWCFKIAQTERYKCLAYEGNIGTELEKAMKENNYDIVCSMIERTITDALLVNPRTEWVRDFHFSYNADQLSISFVVKGINFDRSFKVTI